MQKRVAAFEVVFWHSYLPEGDIFVYIYMYHSGPACVAHKNFTQGAAAQNWVSGYIEILEFFSVLAAASLGGSGGG